MLFQTLLVTAGQPMLGLIVTILGGVANIVLDCVFLVPLQMGIAGAAVAMGIGYSIPALFGLLCSALHRKDPLCFVSSRAGGKMLLQCCVNGSSEMVTNLSTAVTTFFQPVADALCGRGFGYNLTGWKSGALLCYNHNNRCFAF